MSSNEAFGEVTNNQHVIWMEKFLAHEDRVIEIVSEYKSKLAELNVDPMDQHHADSYFRGIRERCRSRREKFNQAIKDEDYDEIDRMLKLKNHGCTGYFTLIQNMIDYYEQKRLRPTPDQFEELEPELIEYPAPDPYY
ncbi:hypothetical protein HA402_008663 [Bradysia odoriphaga]|nr:hypothetical protein HA402_008663 [Bradysia odoriphaga]